MDIIIDANIIFAIMIKKGITEKILFSNQLHCYAPEYIFVEVKEHKNDILKITHRPKEDIDRLVAILERRLEFIPVSEFKRYLQEAENISPDIDDVSYLAVCLAKKMPLWSNDNYFMEQKKIPVFTTQQLIKHLQFKEDLKRGLDL